MKVFAKVGATDRAAINCTQAEVEPTKERLAELLGGKWELVEDVVLSSQVILFEDSSWYMGYMTKTFPAVKIRDIWS